MSLHSRSYNNRYRLLLDPFQHCYSPFEVRAAVPADSMAVMSTKSPQTQRGRGLQSNRQRSPLIPVHFVSTHFVPSFQCVSAHDKGMCLILLALSLFGTCVFCWRRFQLLMVIFRFQVAEVSDGSESILLRIRKAKR
jgi:hypothetical protein